MIEPSNSILAVHQWINLHLSVTTLSKEEIPCRFKRAIAATILKKPVESVDVKDFDGLDMTVYSVAHDERSAVYWKHIQDESVYIFLGSNYDYVFSNSNLLCLELVLIYGVSVHDLKLKTDRYYGYIAAVRHYALNEY